MASLEGDGSWRTSLLVRRLQAPGRASCVPQRPGGRRSWRGPSGSGGRRLTADTSVTSVAVHQTARCCHCRLMRCPRLSRLAETADGFSEGCSTSVSTPFEHREALRVHSGPGHWGWRVGVAPERGQDWQTQPRAMAPSPVAEQNRVAIASWLACGCGHTSHVSSAMGRAASSRRDPCSRSRTSAEVVMGGRSVEEVMAETA